MDIPAPEPDLWRFFISEFVGTALLIILGCGVVANVLLGKTKGNSSGWIVITFGWAMAVFIGVSASWALKGDGHLNPAITLALSVFPGFDSNKLMPYLTGQLSGAIAGAMIVWVAYKQHFDEPGDPDTKLAVFCTAPAIRNPLYNLLTEIIGTFVLVLGALLLSKQESSTGALGPLSVGLLVLAIGLSLGGPTGYAINPARDLGPRLAYFILPIKNKRDPDWNYAWIPVVGPVVGAVIGVFIFRELF